ncbi:MAG: ABC transporter ATP-binding protein [Candidatus Eremiobacteraeota bacterium]|nr:ABC transporter ATP-binding protein [Candidatus Eremiobacteraeota bacterium]
MKVTTNNVPVALDRASKEYPGGVTALHDVSFTVAPGELLGLLGPSGCGKSTVLNLIGCIDLPTAGHVLIAGSDTALLKDDDLTRLRRDRVGTVFQFFNLLPTLTLAENVGLPLSLQRVARSEIERRVKAVMETVGLSDRLAAYPAQVSGGQLQRAAIARAIIHEPAIVLADEPTGNLDSKNGENVLKILRALSDAGQTIVMATHSLEAANICDRRIHLLDGVISGQT